MTLRERETIQHQSLIRRGRLIKHQWRRVLREGESDFSNEGETSRKVVCVSDDDRAGSPELGSGLSLSIQELNSIVTVQSQANLREVQETESSESVMKEILDLVSKPSGSKELSGDLINSKPRAGMRSRTAKSSRSYPKIADSRNYTYDEMIEYQKNLNDSDILEQ